jgi:chlorite dismutase
MRSDAIKVRLPRSGQMIGNRSSTIDCVPDRGQYVAYTFYKMDPSWRRLPIEERAAAKEAFADAVEAFAPRFEHLRAYSCTGVRPDCDFFLWKISERYELLGELGTALNGTPLAGWLETP